MRPTRLAVEEEEYLKNLLVEYKNAQEALNGFMAFVSFKYKLTNADRVDEDGNILYGKEEE